MTSTNGTTVATRPVENHGALALRGDQIDWSPDQRAALAQIGVEQAPPGDQKVFLHVAQRSGLDPFARQIYMISRWDPQAGRDKWTIQTGIDGYRVIAERRKEYGGQLEPQWCGEDGGWKDVWTSKEPPAAARVGVVRNDWKQPAWGVVHFWEFAATKRNGDLTHMWATKGRHQISKCAEAAALRRAFPQDFAGIYIDDEMEHLDNQPRFVIEQDTPEQPAEPDWAALIAEHESARDRDKLTDLWKLARGMRPNDTALLEQIAQAGMRLKQSAAEPAPPPVECAADSGITEQQGAQLWATLSEGQINRDTELALLSHLTGREITTSDDLTEPEAEAAITRLGELAGHAATAGVPLVEVIVEILDRPEDAETPGGAE